MNLYDVGTSIQLAIAVLAAGTAVFMLQVFFCRKRLYLIVMAALSLVIAFDQIWWTLAREAFAGKEWVSAALAFALAGGIEAKTFFETSSWVVAIKGAFFACYCYLAIFTARRMIDCGCADARGGIVVSGGFIVLAVAAAAALYLL